jgi:3-deoxy-D-manno-octulosonic-acid transferase
LRSLARRILKNVSLFLVQTARDRERLEDLGIPLPRIRVAGNLKADMQLPRLSQADTEDLRRELGIPAGKKVIVAGSTHKGEEEMILAAYLEARERRPDLLLVIAPRHPQRTGDAEKICSGLGLKTTRRTEVDRRASWEVLVLDTIGELGRIYGLADVAFIGGSLVPRGGQNLLEPAFYGKPIAFGPYMQNFASLAEAFLEAGAARLVRSKTELAEVFSKAGDPHLTETGRKAGELLISFQGATERTLQIVEELMAEAKGER